MYKLRNDTNAILFCCSPEVEFAGYSLEHPVYRHMNLRLQVKPDSEKKSEQVLSDTLHTTRGVMESLGDAMSQAMGSWEMNNNNS